MGAPVAGTLVTYLGVRAGAFLGKKALTTYGKKTAAKRMQAEAARRGGIAMAPAPQGPLGTLALIQLSTGGEHTSRSGTPFTGTTTPGPSAQFQSRVSRNKPRGMISLANRRGAPSRGRRRPRTAKKWCRRHKRYDYCYMR